MAKGVNRVILLGHVGADPESRKTASGTPVTNFRIATTEKWKDRQTGESQERTEWHRITTFGRLAEVAAQYITKGRQIYVEGSIRTRKWQGQDGQDRYTTEIAAREMQLLDGGGNRSSGNGGSGYQQQSQPQHGRNPEPQDFDEDIPF